MGFEGLKMISDNEIWVFNGKIRESHEKIIFKIKHSNHKIKVPRSQLEYRHIIHGITNGAKKILVSSSTIQLFNTRSNSFLFSK